MLITRKGRLKITDFGCSHLIENGTDALIKTVGSNYYFAPEVWKGKRHKGKPSDIWALGVTLYYMIFKDYPFKAGVNEYQVLYDRIINSEPDYPTTVEDQLVNFIWNFMHIGRGLVKKNARKRSRKSHYNMRNQAAWLGHW